MKNYTIGKTFLLSMIIVLGLQLETNAQNPLLSQIDGGASWSNEFNKPIATLGSGLNITLDENDYSLIIRNTNNQVTLPDPTTCDGRIYVIANYTSSSQALLGHTYWSISANSNTGNNVPAKTSITIQSNGSAWFELE